MIIKRIVLHNIRSYTDCDIQLSQGSVLIAGDIGSGKSTILLSVEFAFFGLLKGEISGGMLLRHGANEGFVELHFILDSIEIIIHRNLKRTSKGIEQDSGFIVQNGKKFDLAPTEIKARILELIGYPAELVTKNKSLLFRYTVYAPQEEMRKILFGDADERLSIIRRIFGIDKYKRVRENADIYLRHLREVQKELAGRVIDLPEKKLRVQNLDSDLAAAKKLLCDNELGLISAKEDVARARLEISGFEDNKKKHFELIQSLNVCIVGIKHLEFEKSRIVIEITALSERIILLKKELENVLIEDLTCIKQEIIQKNNELAGFEKEKFSTVSDSSRATTLQRISLDVIQKINSIDVCPLCLQKVNETHKESIISVENSKILSAKEKLAQVVEFQKGIDERIAAKKADIDLLKNKERGVEFLKFKQNDLLERSKKLELVNARLALVENELSQLFSKKSALEQDIAACSFVEENYARAKLLLDAALLKEKNLDIAHNVLKEKIAGIENSRVLLDCEIKEKELFVSRLESFKRLNGWIVDFFVPLVGSIEKQVLARVHTEFDGLFRKWFGMLVEDEMFSARLDDSFSPVLQQNGFDTLPENLSGGEKTACALAYRLALNKVINDVMTLVRTKDLLILDEPTDGFSDVQLDKVGDVIENLGLKQVIIVSHERKMEGFVGSILHLEKKGHVSCLKS